MRYKTKVAATAAAMFAGVGGIAGVARAQTSVPSTTRPAVTAPAPTVPAPEATTGPDTDTAQQGDTAGVDVAVPGAPDASGGHADGAGDVQHDGGASEQ